MKMKAASLIAHIEKANMGGLVNEMIIDENFKFVVTDESRSVLAVSRIGVPGSDLGKIGVFDLVLLKNLVQYAATSIFDQDEELDLKVVGNRLVIKKEKNEVKFLLSNIKVISSTVEDIDGTLTKLRAKDGIEVALNTADIDKCIKAIALINPEIVLFSVKDSHVTCLIGKENEHNTLLNLGTTKEKSQQQFTVKFKPDLLTRILQVLPLEEAITLELRSDCPIIFSSEHYVFVVSPIRDEA